MKIYCKCNLCNGKIYLSSPAQSRQQLANNFGTNFFLNCSHCQLPNQVHINFVNAEPSYDKIPYFTILGGGLLGILAGPLGIFIGLAAGGTTGGIVRSRDIESVKRFNSNYL